MNRRETHSHPRSGALPMLAFWLYVGVPLAWGVTSTVQKAMALFA